VTTDRGKPQSEYRNAAVTSPGGDDTVGAERRNGRLYLTGLAVSVIGDNAMSLAAGIWVKSLTGSSSEAALVSVCVYAPSLAGPLAGVVADRVRRRRFLIWLHLVSAALVLAALAVGGPGSIWIIFAVMTWYGIHLTLSGPAENALFAVMLSRELRQELNGWGLGFQEAGRLVSPLFGAGLFALVGGGTVSVFDAVTFVIAAVMFSRIRLREARPVPQPGHWRADLLAGFGHIRRTPELRRLLRSAGEGWLAVLGMANFALGNAMRATGWLPLAVAGSVVLGFALPWLFLALPNLAQRCTPPELQGRVSAAVTLAFFGPTAAQRGVSLTTSAGSLSSRRPSNRGWRSRPSEVHSAKPISATSRGSVQCVPGRGGLPSWNGDAFHSSRDSELCRARSVPAVKPVPTLPA
jgi:MFS family permease